MSVKLYDDALKNKLSSWTLNTNIEILKPDETRRLFEMIADNKKDSAIHLPLISIQRPAGFSVLRPVKAPLAFDGFTIDANDSKASQLNAIPISIPYQIDIYTRYQEEADEYARNLVFNIVNFPKLEVSLPYYESDLSHVASIRMDANVEDNSNIPERLISGQFTRLTIQLTIDDAYLFDLKYRDVYKIYTEFTEN